MVLFEKLSGNHLAKFQPNLLSGYQLGVKTYVQLAKILLLRKKEKHFLRSLSSNEIMTPKCPVSYIVINTRRGSAFANDRTLTGNK